jgi:hypothetical protein
MRTFPRTPCRILLSHDLNPSNRDKDRTNPLGLRRSRMQDVGIHRILLYRSTIVHDEDRDRRCRLALEEKLDLARQIIPTVGYRLPRPSPCSACQGRRLSSHDDRRARLPALPSPSPRSILVRSPGAGNRRHPIRLTGDRLLPVAVPCSLADERVLGETVEASPVS